MSIKDFTEQQKQALLDLVTLAMYADGHLAGAEDERVLCLLGTMGFTTDHDRGKHYDAAVTRVSRHSQTAEGARAFALTQAQTFATREQRRLAAQVLSDVVTSDGHVSDRESGFLTLVTEVLDR